MMNPHKKQLDHELIIKLNGKKPKKYFLFYPKKKKKKKKKSQNLFFINRNAHTGTLFKHLKNFKVSQLSST